MNKSEFDKFKNDLNTLLYLHRVALGSDIDIHIEEYEMTYHRFLDCWGMVEEKEIEHKFTPEEYIAHIKNICGVNDKLMGKE